GLVYCLFVVPSTGGGKIKINTITPENYPWGGYYYPNIPIEVSAEPDTGYIFSGWAQFPDSSESMKIQITDGFTLTAMFEPYIVGDTVDLVINEINYNSSDDFNPEDWIEIYNNGVDSVNISGWFFTDENEDHRYTFPEHTIIHAGEYLLLAQDTSAFFNLFLPTSDVFGSFEFGLSGGGELISLYDVSGRLVDRLEYDDSAPWPIEPDGNGPTLELISPDIPNDIAGAWSFSSGHGTPGEQNSVFGSLDNEFEKTVPNTYSLFPGYPNPFNSNVKIKFAIPSEQFVEIIILNILGEKVRTLTNSNYGPGLNTLFWDGENDYGQELSTGLYFCSLKTKKFQDSIKLLLVK
nr:lamin tail domain-containing protein [Candidatus Neomarinimicrobiota bacterium]